VRFLKKEEIVHLGEKTTESFCFHSFVPWKADSEEIKKHPQFKKVEVTEVEKEEELKIYLTQNYEKFDYIQKDFHFLFLPGKNVCEIDISTLDQNETFYVSAEDSFGDIYGYSNLKSNQLIDFIKVLKEEYEAKEILVFKESDGLTLDEHWITYLKII
jgi:hypothetical protein